MQKEVTLNLQLFNYHFNTTNHSHLYTNFGCLPYFSYSEASLPVYAFPDKFDLDVFRTGRSPSSVSSPEDSTIVFVMVVLVLVLVDRLRLFERTGGGSLETPSSSCANNLFPSCYVLLYDYII